MHDLEEFQYKAKEEGLANLISESAGEYVTPANFNKIVAELEKQMRQAADNLDFELAARLRDKIFALNEMNAKRKGRGK